MSGPTSLLCFSSFLGLDKDTESFWLSNTGAFTFCISPSAVMMFKSSINNKHFFNLPYNAMSTNKMLLSLYVLLLWWCEHISIYLRPWQFNKVKRSSNEFGNNTTRLVYGSRYFKYIFVLGNHISWIWFGENRNIFTLCIQNVLS